MTEKPLAQKGRPVTNKLDQIPASPEDIAKAVRVFVDGSLGKSTGNILNVDGGVAVAFVR